MIIRKVTAPYLKDFGDVLLTDLFLASSESKTKETCRLSDDGCKSLSSLLPQFKKEDKFSLKVLNCHLGNVNQSLVKNKVLYHKTSYSKYNQRIINRLIEKKDEVNISIIDSDINSPKRPRRSNGDETYDIGILICKFCKHSGNTETLCAAGTLHATTKKVKLDHVTIFTDRLKSMRVEVGNSDILPTLSSRDITSNEIYYHKISYINVRTQYRDTLQKRA